MMGSSDKPSPAPDASARERIDALLDEALKESFPASDSSAIGSGISAIKQEDRQRHANKSTLGQKDAKHATPGNQTTP